MTAKKFPKIEDIVNELTSDLELREFSRVIPKKDEIVRYKKISSRKGFEIGIEENTEDTEEPEFNHILLAVNYNLPEGVPEYMGERIIPNGDLMHDFFRTTEIYHHSLCINTDKNKPKDGKISIFYHIGFEKDKTSAGEMRAVLREVIDYFCNYITANTDMLAITSSLKE